MDRTVNIIYVLWTLDLLFVVEEHFWVLRLMEIYTYWPKETAEQKNKADHMTLTKLNKWKLYNRKLIWLFIVSEWPPIDIPPHTQTANQGNMIILSHEATWGIVAITV